MQSDALALLGGGFPRSVALTQLRFTSLTVASSREDFHLQNRAHAGRAKRNPAEAGFDGCCAEGA